MKPKLKVKTKQNKSKQQQQQYNKAKLNWAQDKNSTKLGKAKATRNLNKMKSNSTV